MSIHKDTRNIKLQKSYFNGFQILSDQGLNCTFDDGTCGFVQPVPWLVSQGWSPQVALPHDHTTGQGKFVYLSENMNAGKMN